MPARWLSRASLDISAFLPFYEAARVYTRAGFPWLLGDDDALFFQQPTIEFHEYRRQVLDLIFQMVYKRSKSRTLEERNWNESYVSCIGGRFFRGVSRTRFWSPRVCC